MVRLFRAKKKNTSGRRKRDGRRADRIIFDTAPNPNPAAPSNKANLEMNQKIKDNENVEANE